LNWQNYFGLLAKIEGPNLTASRRVVGGVGLAFYPGNILKAIRVFDGAL